MSDHDFSWLADLLSDLFESLVDLIIEGPRGLLVAVLLLVVLAGVAYAIWG